MADGWVGRTVPDSTWSPVSLSKVVVTFCRLACPGVGAWNPVLTDPRTLMVSLTMYRTATLPLSVPPKSEKYS